MASVRLSLVDAIPGKHSPTNYGSQAKSTAYTSIGTSGVVGSMDILTKSFETSTSSRKAPRCKGRWNQSPTSWERDLQSPAFFYSSTAWQGSSPFTRALFPQQESGRRGNFLCVASDYGQSLNLIKETVNFYTSIILAQISQ